jgi:hypothetical protein
MLLLAMEILQLDTTRAIISVSLSKSVRELELIYGLQITWQVRVLAGKFKGICSSLLQ